MNYRFATVLLLCTCAQAAWGQVRYVGTVGAAPIELTLVDAPDENMTGVYVYTRFDTPIALSGTLKQGVLRLTERNGVGKATAALTLPGFAATTQTAAGTWQNLATGQQLPVALTRVSGQEPGPDAAAPKRELLQVESLPGRYFKTVLTGNAGDFDREITSVRLFEKKTHRLVQEFAVSCQSRGLHSVLVGDFNFDGHPDFSVFESSYAGPNTTSLYFLYSPATKRYAASGFEGTSLEFDAKKQRIYEHNSCCAGTSVTMAEYRVVRNRMVLVAQHCYRWDDKKQALVERKPSACQ